jgi:hypothetical protein
MPIPNRREDLKSFGYEFLDKAFCSGCDQAIEWWSTPNRKKMPFEVIVVDDRDWLVPHWNTCPVADRFRSRE